MSQFQLLNKKNQHVENYDTFAEKSKFSMMKIERRQFYDSLQLEIFHVILH